MAQGPINIPRGAESPSSGGVRTCRVVVGTSTAGWTAADCDYLCDGVEDQVEIQQAIDDVEAAGGGKIVFLGGEYVLSYQENDGLEYYDYAGLYIHSSVSLAFEGEGDVTFWYDMTTYKAKHPISYTTGVLAVIRSISNLAHPLSFKNIKFKQAHDVLDKTEQVLSFFCAPSKTADLLIGLCEFSGFKWCFYGCNGVTAILSKFGTGTDFSKAIHDLVFPVANAGVNVRITDCTGYCGGLFNLTRPENVYIQNCVFHTKGYILYLTGSMSSSGRTSIQQGAITGNIFYDDRSIFRGQDSNNILQLSRATNIVVSDNVFDCLRYNDYVWDEEWQEYIAPTYHNAINLDDRLEGCLVSNNVIIAPENYRIKNSITAGYADKNRIEGNLVFGVAHTEPDPPTT